MKKYHYHLLLVSVAILLFSCSKESSSTTTTKSEIKVTFRGKTQTITKTDYPSLYAATSSIPVATSTGGQQQLSRVSFYGENSQIAVGTAAFKKGTPDGTYSFEALLGQYNQYWRLGAFYQHSQDVPAPSSSSSVPAAGEIIAVVIVDKTAGNAAYIPVPSACSVSVTSATDKQITGTFNLQVKNGSTTETATGSFNFVK